MITEQNFNLWLIEYYLIIGYVISLGFMVVMVCLSFVYRLLALMDRELKTLDEIDLFLLSAMATIVSIPFVCSFFILFGMILKWIFVK